MHAANTLLLGLIAAATDTLAAPPLNTRAQAVSAMAQAPEWIIRDFTRSCNARGTACRVSFSIDTQTAPATECGFMISGAPAIQSSTSGITCGPYTISSSWSGQFGPDNGFTTYSVIDWANHLIIWPAYADSEVQNGVSVTPDKSYAPQTLA
ncbi:hypothetical protein C8A05DRAFT_33590 [Staphylotrichum tortipilum]|uniref:Small secreted protein n=1 Tax=Staphylotrichum tortipilum TaxID=2831512 RepID=A0AAN6MKP3_9PEZI|nr:hypothetical protein C8A05DRAFT_33590 [Staphylotrichum longicolle]